jgi:hypothetical protein
MSDRDRKFLIRFEASAIPLEEWTHEAHLRMAFILLEELPFEDAVERMRHGIQRLNRAQGVENSATSGFHETLTVAWARLVAARVRSCDAGLDSLGFLAVYRKVLGQRAIFDYYTRERVFTEEARFSFVEPDRRLLPPVVDTRPKATVARLQGDTFPDPARRGAIGQAHV